MTNYSDINRINYLNKLCAECGFTYKQHKSGAYNYTDELDLFAKEELAAYSPEHPLFKGSVETLITFLEGWRTAFECLMAISAITPKIITDKREKHLAKIKQLRETKDE